MNLDEQFEQATQFVRALPATGSFQPNTSLRLFFYAHYKQVPPFLLTSTGIVIVGDGR